MKETLYTIPLMDAFKAEDECPFCYIERKLEQDSLDYILGSASAYMQSDIREKTNRLGFCRAHYRRMFQYGNTLGNAIMLSSYFKELNEELQKKLSGTKPGKPSLFRRKKSAPEDDASEDQSSNTALSSWIRRRETDCFLCGKQKDTYRRYIDTFFMMVRSDSDFYQTMKHSKGFCLYHFADLIGEADSRLNGRQLEDFYKDLFALMKENMNRIEEDVDWFIDKFDYRNRDADWKNSRDAVQRAMQKLCGGYPADPPYKAK